jgi:hypothetical protein
MFLSLQLDPTSDMHNQGKKMATYIYIEVDPYIKKAEPKLHGARL